jgi:hypothetical protein
MGGFEIKLRNINIKNMLRKQPIYKLWRKEILRIQKFQITESHYNRSQGKKLRSDYMKPQ